MFWRFGGYANISTLDTILDKPDVTLEELLDESDLIQELKQHNTKLIEYLRDENVLRRLLEYVVAPQANSDEDEGNPSEDGGAGAGAAHDTVENEKGPKLIMIEKDMSEEERDKLEKARLKYSYVATEVLSSETWSILEALMENQQHLREFWEFLRRPPPLDNTTAGYFTKINETLLDKKTEEMLEFFRSLDNGVPTMLQHVDCPVVMDLLLKIISLEKAEGGQGIVDWLQSQNLIPSLLSYLSADHSPATQTSAGDFLKAIITISANASQNEQSCIGPNDMTRQLVSVSCIESLISDMLRGGNPLTVGVGIIIEVIRKNNSDYDPDVGTGADSVPSSRDPIYLGTLLRMFAKHVPDFMELILSPNHRISTGDGTKVIKREPLKAAFGEKIEPLGFDRFKTCELMAELLHCSNMGLLNERGSELYVKERDQERERLKADGASTHAQEGQSGADYTEDSAGFHHGNSPSAIGSGSPEEIRRLEVANSGDDDGFEDVGASGVLNEDVKDDFDEESASEKRSGQSEKDASVRQGKPRLDLGDEFVDEPLSSPRLDAQLPKKVVEGGVPSVTSGAGMSKPLSLTSSELTEKVGGLDLDNDTIMTSPPSSDSTYEEQQHEPKPGPAVSSEQSAMGEHKLAPPLPRRDQPPESKPTGPSSPGDLSPHPDDEPAPLFAARSEQITHQDEPTSKPSEREIGGGNSQETIDTTLGEEGDSVRSILLSGNEQDFEPHIESDIDGQPVVGDFLKMMFVEHRVVPTILDFFFRFPWNNFLHNVVYDVVQQVFNGPMDRGYNRSLAIDLFETGRITEHIVEGQKRSDEAQERNRMRLGYMGHLTLVAEEVVKFSERNPTQLLPQSVLDKVMHKQWIDYVEHTLSETRERDNAILGGVRPDMSLGPRQAVINAVNAAQGFGNSGSSALANAGLNGGVAQALDSIDLANSGSASSGTFGLGGGSLLSGFGSSSDEEDEEMDEGEEHEGAARGSSDQQFSTFISSSLSALDNFGSTSSSNPSSTPDGPPPPPPLNIPPSRARRQLAARLALQKQKQAQQSATAQETTSRTAADISSATGDTDLVSSPPTLYAEPSDSSQEILSTLNASASSPSTSLSMLSSSFSPHQQQQQNRTSTSTSPSPAILSTTSPTLFAPAANSSSSSSSSASSSSDSDSNDEADAAGGHNNESATQSNNNNSNQTAAPPHSPTPLNPTIKKAKPHHHRRRRRRRPSTTEATTRSALEPDSSSSSSSSSDNNNNNTEEAEGKMIDVKLHRPRAGLLDSDDARPDIDGEMVEEMVEDGEDGNEDEDGDEDGDEDEEEVVEMRGMRRGDLLVAQKRSGSGGGERGVSGSGR